MAWRDTLQTASFRGVSFKIEFVENEYSRNLILHEFPLRESVYVEDLGRKISKYDLHCFIVGDNYNNDRDNLIKALQQAGSGILIHPYLGTLEVYIESFFIRESYDEGRLARITIAAVEAGDKLYPNKIVDNPGLITNRSNVLLVAGVEHFENTAVLTNVTDFVRAGATGKVGFFAGTLKDLIRAGGLVNAGISGLLNAKQYFSNQTNLIQDLTRLINPNPELTTDALTFGNLVQGTMSQINALTGGGRQTRKLLKTGRTVKATPVSEYTSNEELQNKNDQAAVDLIKVITIAEEAKATISIPFISTDDALATRSDITTQLDTLMEETTSDDVYRALADLKTTLIAAIPEPESDLPNIETINLVNPIPSLVLSYELYGNLNREGQIIDINQIAHPGFIPSGPVEVLING